MIALSVIVPTYCREQVLIDTLGFVLEQMQLGDKLLVIDQTPRHEPPTEQALSAWARDGRLRWYRKLRPGQVEAMNVGALLAQNDGLVFLDDDVVPDSELLDAYRHALANKPEASAFCGQVLQPWHAKPLAQVEDFELRFDPAYDRECDVMALMEGNFAIRRQTYLDVGGMDENFSGCTYRHGTELAYRITRLLGRKPRFLPAASLRHLYAGGGQRAHGAKDTWGHLGASVGDYYFAMRCLSPVRCVTHSLTRWWRAALNRHTVTHPWLVPSMAMREVVAWTKACWRAWGRPGRFVRPLESYADCTPLNRSLTVAASKSLIPGDAR